jgi:type II secretory pathway predicted ATPase ExeA
MNNSSQILKELQELRITWKRQNLTFTSAQQERYTELTELRRAFIELWTEQGRVWVGPSKAGNNFDRGETAEV